MVFGLWLHIGKCDREPTVTSAAAVHAKTYTILEITRKTSAWNTLIVQQQ